ncbi:hypothetical protein AJ80_03120 [Polytolypa hystricis UAMH7299]|uniref:Kinetochore protein mis14 n=1 Tax=Polytolypa hystricis (strain UAMH7299) TaxID=1447883 RepID=A0A2B7YK47_POLH7|nr:hypothetical protein AJ80_03120 [Polytolypa hystricis UAMH7299]
MQGPHHRKIELQSTADLSYLYANTVALSRQKLDLHFPPSATNDADPMKERVRELVDEFITKTFTSATSSISINGLDSSTSSASGASFPLHSFLSAREAIEYEPFDANLASRVTALYAQLESLTTTVAQMRRDAPGRAAKVLGEELEKALVDDEDEVDDGEEEEEGDIEMKDADADAPAAEQHTRRHGKKKPYKRDPSWNLTIPFGNEAEQQRWQDGEMSDVYADALRTLARLQGEVVSGEEEDEEGDGDEGTSSRALATTVGKVDRARRAAEVVEKM